ncbi:HesA/MoeB/ThiF family protein [Chelatococcus asaccharovorans]|uniref:Molybdopterin-synthase adenylyltransferase n=1 Tax=Chelatococcus asaccharovorans TaxID=28210 RepID=A0A2V3U8P3_9HYPH|nr:molybdopterin-synthase adenylyltransferase MoeB [Chelatococcus asaccharovorans]MBS7705410.1 molybdopterin-synthase adenylyltransferase MoeB [Chelatococcus asaccharovorans]PXW60185.1 adenylyltransferase/sulfurtransferase [Chelatococcus asaccharovorans]
MSTSLTPGERQHYIRQMIVPGWGESGQERLKAARVLVIGAGGLGAPVLMYLAAAGVGTIGVADGDFVEISNLHRQVIHGADSLNRPKVASAATRLRQSNPHIEIVEHMFPVNRDNAAELIGQYDLVADCTDNFPTRDAVADACRRARVPLVSGAAQITDGTVTTFMPYRGADHPCFRCLYPKPLDASVTPTCAEIGVVGPVLAVIGGLQAMEAIKEILSLGDSLSGRILVYDALSAKISEFALDKRSGCVCNAMENEAPQAEPAFSRP